MAVNPLVDAVQRAATDLPATLVAALAEAVEPWLESGAAATNAAFDVNPAAPYRRHADAVCGAWERSAPNIPGVAVAVALRAALAAVTELSERQAVDLVWTGPTSASVPVSKSRDTLLRVVQSANRSLWLLSFVASAVPELVATIKDATDRRRVDVRLVLETEKDSKGRLDYDARRAFSELGDRVLFLVWPGDRRPAGHSLMHAKAALADRRTLLVTSANLTGAAVDQHMELGLLVTGGPVPQRFDAHLRALVADGELVPVS